MQDDFGNAVAPPAGIGISARLDAGDQRMGRIEGDVAAVREELAANTEATRQVAANTADLVEFFQAVQGAFKVLNWIGKVAKPVGAIATATAAAIGVWSAVKGFFR
ncbi:hypothetical protein [Acidovorax sp. Leaf78]|jgi:hypothetical protein|uniref:hypothetical protein n=1 Tax=Acidovorax sp. Leaf78 TaxID=1736237 RepID=UPI0006FAB8AF|nr:hypothetical protein [Acidovorax sp. Leaf78]KQO23506.1 hypothetical protein ASF16_04910 [Acidovorax sp. Leaf78]